MSAFTVLHTADWHLGVRLREMERVAEHAAFLTWLTNTAENEGADLLVIAGDIFDSANPPQSALKMWYDFLAALRRRCPRCAVIAVAGNHDSPHVLEAASAPLAGLDVRIVGEMPSDGAQCLHVFPDKDGKPALVVAAVPFLRDRDLRSGGDDSTAGDIPAQLREGIRARYAAVAEAVLPFKSQGCAALATGHLTIAGGSTSESERDIHIGNLGAVSSDVLGTAFDCIALGHLHRPQMAGGDHIRYSGSPIALSFSEWRDEKQIRALTFENGALVASRSLVVPCTRQLLRVPLTSETLEAEFAALTLSDSPLPAWLEITVAGTSEPSAALAERIEAALAGRHAEAIAIRRHSAEGAGTASGADSINDLQPAAVFAAMLDAASIPETEREPLHLTFQQLLERHHESLTAAP